MKCGRPECTEEASRFWEGMWLCYGHAVEKREAKLTIILHEANNAANEVWRAFYDSKKSDRGVDSLEKQA